MSNSPQEGWKAQEMGTLALLVVPAGTQGYYFLGQPKCCQECELDLGDKTAMGSEEQCLGTPRKVGRDSAACQLLSPHPSGEVRGHLPHRLAGDAHQGLSPTTQTLVLPRAPLMA